MVGRVVLVIPMLKTPFKTLSRFSTVYQQYPITAELIRRAERPVPIGLESQCIAGLWEADSVARASIREQLFALIGKTGFASPQTQNNLIMLVSYWQYWVISAAEGIKCLHQLEGKLQLHEHAGLLNYFGFRAREEAITGDFEAAYASLSRTLELLGPGLSNGDLWNLANRISAICYYAGFKEETLAFTRAALMLAESSSSLAFSSNARFIYAATLLDCGGLAQSEALLSGLLSATHAGTAAIVPFDLPMLPVHLANAKLLQNRPREAADLLAQSREFNANQAVRLGDMHRCLTGARLSVVQGGGAKVQSKLGEFCERMSGSEHINFSMVDNCLDILAEVPGLAEKDRVFKQFIAWQSATRPSLHSWKPLLSRVHALLTERNSGALPEDEQRLCL